MLQISCILQSNCNNKYLRYIVLYISNIFRTQALYTSILNVFLMQSPYPANFAQIVWVKSSPVCLSNIRVLTRMVASDRCIKWVKSNMSWVKSESQLDWSRIFVAYISNWSLLSDTHIVKLGCFVGFQCYENWKTQDKLSFSESCRGSGHL